MVFRTLIDVLLQFYVACISYVHCARQVTLRKLTLCLHMLVCLQPRRGARQRLVRGQRRLYHGVARLGQYH